MKSDEIIALAEKHGGYNSKLHCWQFNDGGLRKLAAELTAQHSGASATAAPAVVEPTYEQLGALFTKESGGPNPYYRCCVCEGIVPGLGDHLNDHWRTHQPTPPLKGQPEGAPR